MTDGNGATLTPREAEVIGWIARGKTAHEVSAILGLSYRTARFHADNARRKLDAVNTAHTVAEAYQAGILTVEKPL